MALIPHSVIGDPKDVSENDLEMILDDDDEVELISRYEEILHELRLNLQMKKRDRLRKQKRRQRQQQQLKQQQHQQQLKQQQHQQQQQTTVDLPLELVAIVLDYLPQHRVYPFLSLSKGVDYIAKRRLLRKVYVLADNPPLLHDAIDELKQWSFLTQDQFLHLMRHEVKWPGELVVMENPPWSDPLFEAIEKQLQPAELFDINSLPDSTKYKEQIIPTSLPTSFTATPHLARLTLVGPITLDALPTRIKADNLQLFSNVVGVAKCIDLSSVKQLSIAYGYGDEDDNIYKVASKLTRLEDLYIARYHLKPEDLSGFPDTIKRLVLNDVKQNHFSCVKRFRKSLEYLEFGKGTLHQNWPRRLYKTAQSKYGGKINGEKFPKLKVYVNGNEVYMIDRILGEYYRVVKLN